MSRLVVGSKYDRHELAKEWGYKSHRALARGVFTPQGQNLVLLFISGDHAPSQVQYDNSFDGRTLQMDGETNHANDQRIADAAQSGDEVHLFYRQGHRDHFVYYGIVALRKPTLMTGDTPSKFEFELV